MNRKATEIESKMNYITNLTTKAALNTKSKEIENKIHDNTNYLTIPEFNRLIKAGFEAKIKEIARFFQVKVNRIMVLIYHTKVQKK